ncbi:MAG: phenylalanine--tRNA ligase subunit alpha [Nanoarchaeota archaeon]|nr:phenylalanine--tRNA ligase subunit alpha [Nanoarchaeota archaeon]
MKNLGLVIESLHPLERQVLKHIKNNATANQIANLSGMKDVEVMRALQWLEEKNIIAMELKTAEIAEIDKNGESYLKEGFPEKRFLNVLVSSPLTLNQIKENANLNEDELKFSLGFLKNKKYIQMGKEVSITAEGKKFLNSKYGILGKLPKYISELNRDDLLLIEELKKRKNIIKIDSEKIYTVKLKEIAEQLLKSNLDVSLIDALTPNMIKSGSWKNKKFRRYNLNAPVGEAYGAKRHIVPQALNYARRIWLDMGFKEMTGPMIESSFWNFDALFTPQDHPGREMQDTFFIDETSKLPDGKIVSKVKKSHEKGWQYKWDEKTAKETVLRTHTTAISARTLSRLKPSDLPAKFFAIGKCFRNEALDWNHHFEFNQTEGIVIDPEANFKHLLGYLKIFANKMGFQKVRFRPAYFPYTEPSIEGDVYDTVRKKWVEFIAAGILRPEVVKPLLGTDIPVLAWGPGIDRMIASVYKLTDIRDLYRNDLKKLRTSEIWTR